jgi:hypothetical protein
MGEKVEHNTLIDALRGVAAIQVVISHAVTSDMVFWSIGFGAITGVYLFFILPGFLIRSSASRVLPTEGSLPPQSGRLTSIAGSSAPRSRRQRICASCWRNVGRPHGPFAGWPSSGRSRIRSTSGTISSSISS